ncbi:hypothetical protein BCR34DRAFT_556665 [Clohesyomyces aquaticus]|uniref:Uncharacterized protein n=1 Tax=Clohesyomyces aquaticus TaxID=1231657 RepID=A0A1Y2A2S2_9PLEO|nr:hypothetical protein BCR34DRAFT_556665 [Clohesyomyces aquaticus]
MKNKDVDEDNVDVEQIEGHSGGKTRYSYRESSHGRKTVVNYREASNSDDSEDEDISDTDEETYKPAVEKRTRYRGLNSHPGPQIALCVPVRQQVPAFETSRRSPSPPPIEPEIEQRAHQYPQRVPARFPCQILDPDRLAITKQNAWFFAEEGALDPWANAYNAYRFGHGPRRSQPYRQLHLIGDPMFEDASDWSENIRWAKEQHSAFGVTGWTEKAIHMATITEHRVRSLWVSEEVVASGLRQE